MKIPSMPTSPMFRTKPEPSAPVSDLTSRLSGAEGLRTNGGGTIGLGAIHTIDSVQPRVAVAQAAGGMR